MINRHRTVQINDYREQEEWCCVGCGKWLCTDDVVFARPNGELSVEFGDPHCTHCLPPQPEDEYRD